MPVPDVELPWLLQELVSCWSDDVADEGWKFMRRNILDEGGDCYKSSTFLKYDGAAKVFIKIMSEFRRPISSLVAACRPEAMFHSQQSHGESTSLWNQFLEMKVETVYSPGDALAFIRLSPGFFRQIVALYASFAWLGLRRIDGALHFRATMHRDFPKLGAFMLSSVPVDPDSGELASEIGFNIPKIVIFESIDEGRFGDEGKDAIASGCHPSRCKAHHVCRRNTPVVGGVVAICHVAACCRPYQLYLEWRPEHV